MRVTIELSDELWIATEKRAAKLRLPVRVLLEAALRVQLAVDEVSHGGAVKSIHWLIVDGGLPDGADVADRAVMHEWLHDRR